MTRYFLTFDYAATGNGITTAIGIVDANTESEAKIEFLRKVLGWRMSDQYSMDYFIVGVEAHDLTRDGNIEQMMSKLNKVLSSESAKSIMRAVTTNTGFCELFYIFSVN